MANTVSMNLSLQAKGIKEANADAALLADNLERAAKASAMLSGTQQGTSGSRKAAGMGATPQARSRSENEEYNRGRGAMGATGASARDFANQSQGLGGLVRLYATFAANLFAASAAFNALRSAANVTNMVKGLDQLGAASGRNLGSLAKDLVKVTDGAITLQEAMEATAKASAAGMSAENLKRLTTGAKNASQALGLNMSDALSRLTRGVTKLEPELLDELGIFVRVDTAAQKYAQSIGKATSQLTEFERRNAFAAEVLGQVETKFGALNLAANPYDKLLASLKELAQDGLEIVNKVFGPLADFMSSSPTALATAIAGIVTLLVKQAVPAISQFKAGLMKAAEDAANISKQKAEDAVTARKAQLKKLEDTAEHWAENEVARVDAAQKKIQDIQQNSFKKTSASYKILSKTLQEISDKDLAVLERNAKAANKRGDTVSAKAYIDAVEGVREYRKAEEALEDQKKKNLETLEKESKGYNTLAQNIRIAERAEQTARSKAITSNAAYIGSTQGLGTAFKSLHTEISDNGLKGFTKYKTYVTGAFAAATGAVSTFMNAFGTWFAIAGLAIAGISFLFEKMSGTAEQAQRTSEGFDSLNSSIDNVARTLDVINKKDPLEAISVQSIQARANALNDLTDSMGGLTKSVQSQLAAMNGWDIFAEGFKSFFGGGLVKNFNETLAKSIGKALDLTQKDPKLVKGLEGIFGKTISSSAQLETELNRLPEALRNEKWDAIVKLQKELNIANNNAASLSTSMVTAFEAANKAQQDFQNSFKPNDASFKLGSSLVTSAEAINKALADNVNTISELLVLTKDPEKLKVFGPELAQEIISGTKALQDMSVANETNRKATEAVNVELNKKQEILDRLKKKYDTLKQSEKDDGEGVAFLIEIEKLSKEIDKLRSAKTAIDINVEVNKASLDNMLTKIKSAADMQFKSGIKLMMAGSDAEMAKAGATFAQGIASRLGDTETGIKMRTELAQAQISVQLGIIEASEAHIRATIENTLAQRDATLELRKKDADSRDLKVIAKEQESINRDREALRNVKGVTSSTMESLSPEMREAVLSLRGVAAQRIGLQGQSGLLNVDAKLQSDKLAQTNSAKVAQAEIDANNQKVAQLNSILSLNESIDLSLLKQRQELEATIATQEFNKKLAEIDYDIAEKSYLLKKANKDVESDAAIVRLRQQRSGLADSEGSKGALATFKARKELEDAAAKNLNIELDKQADKRKIIYEEQTRSREADLASLEYLKNLNAVSDTFYASQKADMEISKVNAEYENNLADKRTANAKELNMLLATKKTLEGSTDPKDEKALAANQALIAAKTDQWAKEITALTASRDATVGILQLNKELTVEKAKQQEVMDSMISTTQLLSSVFGEMGENIGKAGEAMLKFSQNSENRAAAEKALAKEALNDPKKLEELTKLKSKNTKAELSDIAGVLGATKGLFKEKSKEYKAFAALEKAIHVANLIMTAKELAVKLGFYTAVPAAAMASEATTTAATQAGAAARAPTYLAEIYAKSIGQLGPIAGPAVAAGLIASLLGAITGGDDGGGGVSISNADIQKAQLTGQGYDKAGNLVTVAGGVFGDPSANVKGIADSIDRLNETFFDGLGNKNSSLLKHLRGIQENTAQTVSALIRAGGGSITPNISLPGSSASNLGDGLNSIPLIGNALSGIVNWLGGGGSKTYSNLDSQYLRIRGGSLADYANGGMGRPSGYYESNISTQHDKAWYEFSSSYKTYSQQIDKLDPGVLRKVSEIFSDFTGSILDIGDALGDTRQRIIQELTKISANVDFSVIGMSGVQVSEALTAQFDKLMNSTVETLWPWVKDFAKAGDEYSKVMIGLIQDSQTVTFGLAMVQQSLGDFATVQEKFTTQQKLIQNFGDIDVFAEAIQNYYDAMFVDSEKLKFSFKSLQDRLADLGVVGVTTNEQFRALVQLQDPTSTLYAELVKLAPAFDDVTKAMQALTNARDDLVSQVYSLTDNEAANKALKRSKTLADTDPTLKSLQQYVFALEDLKAAEDKLAAARKKNLSIVKKTTDDQLNLLKSTVSSLENFINSIRNFKDSLLVGDKSILNPADKYAESKRQFDEILAIAQGPATTAEEIKARDNALNQIQNTASAFLDASKAYNASSSQYSTDFMSVQNALEMTATTLESKKSDAQTQIDILTAQSDLMQAQLDALDNINNTLQDTASLEAAVESAKLAVSMYATQSDTDQNAFAQTYIDIINEATQKALLSAVQNTTTVTTGTGSSTAVTSSNVTQVVQDATTQAILGLVQQGSGGNDTVGPTTGPTQSLEQSMMSLSTTMANSPTLSGFLNSAYNFATSFTTIGFVVDALAPAFSSALESALAGQYAGSGFTGPGGTTSFAGALPGAPTMGIDPATAMGQTVQAVNDAIAAAEAKAAADKAAAEAAAAAAAAAAEAAAAAAASAAVAAAAAASYSNPYSSGSGYSNSGWDSNGGYNGAGYDAGPTNSSGGYDTGDNGAGGYALAKGGPAHPGYAVVGELGPELVDFKTPGRVYTAEETFGMFNGVNANSELVAEVRQLRQEVRQLREQQRTETGHLINATYDSQNRNANTVAKTIEDTTKTQIWQAKVQQSVVLA